MLEAVGRQMQFSVGSSKWNVTGVFDRQFAEVLGTEAMAPAAVVREADIYAPTHAGEAAYLVTAVDADPAKVGGDHFAVVGVQPDGTGLVTLILERAS